MPNRSRPWMLRGRGTSAGLVSATVGALLAAAGLVQPAVSEAPGGPLPAATLSQVRPRLPMCHLPRPAHPDPVIDQPAAGPRPRRDTTVPGRWVPPTPDPLTPLVTDLWTGGPAPLRTGRYAYVATRTWRYSDFPDVDPASLQWRYPVEQVDVRSWQAADGATFGMVVRDFGVPGYRPALRPYRLPARSPEPSPLTDAVEAWSTDPATLATQVAAWDPDDLRPTYVLQAIAVRYRAVLPTPAQHAAALTVLCTTPGVRMLGPTTDRAGRPGIAVTAEHDFGGNVVQHATLILDPHTWRPQSVSTSVSGPSALFRYDSTIVLLDAGYHDVIS